MGLPVIYLHYIKYSWVPAPGLFNQRIKSRRCATYPYSLGLQSRIAFHRIAKHMKREIEPDYLLRLLSSPTL